MAKKEFTIEKPIEPVKPDWKDKVKYKDVPGKNYSGDTIMVLPPKFNRDYDKWLLDMESYKPKFEKYEQYRLMRLIKNSSNAQCLKKYTITENPVRR